MAAVGEKRRRPTPSHMTALLPTGSQRDTGPGKLLSLALSPDGRTLVIAGTDEKGQRLYERRSIATQTRALAGTEGGAAPFFSPDGAWIGFFADRRLKRVPAGGGAAVDIVATAGYPAGASWGTDDRIVFATGICRRLRCQRRRRNAGTFDQTCLRPWPQFSRRCCRTDAHCSSTSAADPGDRLLSERRTTLVGDA